jgi:hypothetical protein
MKAVRLVILVAWTTVAVAGYPASAKEQDLLHYGNFCGANHPVIVAPDSATAIRKLTEIPAIDRLDAACKAHDICYEARHSLDIDCDRQFVAQINSLRFASTNCALYASFMTRAIVAKPGVEYRPMQGVPNVTIPKSVTVNLFALFDYLLAKGQAATVRFEKPRPGSC